MSIWWEKPYEYPVFLNGKQVAGVSKTLPLDNGTLQYHIRNLRPNGNIGICFKGTIQEVKEFLDYTFTGCTYNLEALP